MIEMFTRWLKMNETKLNHLGIENDNTILPNKDSLNPALSVDHVSKNAMGRVAVWDSYSINIEVIDFNTGEMKICERMDLEKGNIDFDILLKNYIIEMTK